jgi:tetratricopeptide (TPR) repeat protein
MYLRLRIFLAFLLILIISSCSTQKNTLLTRTYHQVTARYNTYFNGRESFRSGVRRAEQQFRFDYNKILPVFLYTDPEIARSVAPQMDRAIDKASKVITNKSITAKPKESGGLFGTRDEDFMQQNEYNRWVMESYLLAGKAHFYKHDYIHAARTFLFIIREYNMNPIRHEAKLWLALTYCERGRFNEARLLFEEMLGDFDFPADLKVELYSTIADFHLKQERLDEAILNLEKSLEIARSKERKIRYTYILAQLYERTGNFSNASDYYARVISMNPPYEMVFNARISQAGVFQAGTGETGRLINELERMLRDEKNRDYLDQVYFAMGNLYLRNNDEANAIKHYTHSAGAPGENPTQKPMTYMALADIYFSRPDYINAQAYYDSAVMNMDQGFPDQQIISKKLEVLTELVINIMQFELQDSVQMLAAMSEVERNRVIDDIIASAREEEADARQRELLARQVPQYRTARTAQAARHQAERAGGGDWYFYNPTAVNFGQNEFESLWGERRLEDNWRRSNRQVISFEQFALMDDEDITGDDAEDAVADTRSRDFYLRDIPLTEQAMQESHQKLEEALFSMGVIYREGLQNYERSIEAYEELLKRYPEGQLSLPAMYDLHSVHMLNSDFRAADHYKNLIVERYPGSPYASILTNPNFYSEYEEQIQAAERYYEETFELFRENRFEQVAERALYASVTWPDSPLIPRFEYLRTLTYGPSGNIPLFRDMLSNYIANYPDTEMAENAVQFIAYLDDDYAETIQMAEVPVIQDIYLPDQQGAHYFALIVDNRQDLINRLVFNIVNFNVDHFARLNLNVSSHTFSTNYQLLRVEGLPGVPSALDYLNRFSASEEVFAETERRDFPMFIISHENYDLFMKDKNIVSYRNFFEEQYLNRQN